MCMYVQVHGNSASIKSLCIEKNLWTSFSKDKVMVVKIKNGSDKVQVKLHDSLQETFNYRQDVVILPYKQPRAQDFPLP